MAYSTPDADCMYGMHEAKTNLSQLIQKAVAGESVIITNNGKPVAKIVPYEDKPKGRRIGFLTGIHVDMEKFAAMDEEIADSFEGQA